MKYQNRTIEPLIKEYLSIFPVTAVTGPRQSGKSTLVRELLGKEYRYVTLDNHSIIEQLEDDPVLFITTYGNKVIFDEVQKYPKIFNLIKQKVDEGRDVYGRYVLTGSSQFTLQQLNASYYAKSVGVSIPTIKRWLSVLEISYIIYLLKPYYSNLNKRIVKSPKIYFYDTGLASYLNGAMDGRWADGPLAGPIFENFIVSECIKQMAHNGKKDELYYFREHNGDQIDLIIDSQQMKQFIEIKHSMTFRPRMIKHLEKYMDKNTESLLLYEGQAMEYGEHIHVANYRDYLSSLYCCGAIANE